MYVYAVREESLVVTSYVLHLHVYNVYSHCYLHSASPNATPHAVTAGSSLLVECCANAR